MGRNVLSLAVLLQKNYSDAELNTHITLRATCFDAPHISNTRTSTTYLDNDNANMDHQLAEDGNPGVEKKEEEELEEGETRSCSSRTKPLPPPLYRLMHRTMQHNTNTPTGRNPTDTASAPRAGRRTWG
jgi:hypothetical protein